MISSLVPASATQLRHDVELIGKSASLLASKDRTHAIDILERLIQGGNQTHRPVGDKVGDAIITELPKQKPIARDDAVCGLRCRLGR